MFLSPQKSVEDAVRGISAYGLDAEEALEGVRRQWALNKDVSDEANASFVRVQLLFLMLMLA